MTMEEPKNGAMCLGYKGARKENCPENRNPKETKKNQNRLCCVEER